jgi:catechol 2,3-dioxygenase-like lactoylglutathione lyase family enzyme
MSLGHSMVTLLLPITDANRAKEFYGQRLRLPLVGVDAEGSLRYRLGGGSELLLLYRPDQRPSEGTALSFEVDDIEAEVARLEESGVIFEDYDLPDLKTTGHICDLETGKAAWFADPDGNILSIHQGITSS